MTRILKVKYSVTPMADFFPDLGVKYQYVLRVRWYQFWLWHLVLTRDYVLSRAAQIVRREQMAEVYRAAAEEESRQFVALVKEARGG